MQTQTSTEDFANQIDQALANLMDDSEFRGGIQAMVRAAVPLLWTAFECLARDLWVAALNAASPKLAHRAFSFVEDPDAGDGVSGKVVSVGLLVKYEFNVRRHVGDLLQRKFQFSSVSGIRKAYSVLGLRQDAASILRDDDLVRLEKTRHLIVHRAARVDGKFKRETDCAQAIGEDVAIDGDCVSRFFEAAAAACVLLIRTSDTWLAEDVS